jgi:hypothetical protein
MMGLAGLALVVAVSRLWVLVSVARPEEEGGGQTPFQPAVTLEGARFGVSSQGERRWVLHAGQVSISRDRSLTLFNSIERAVVFRHGRRWLTLATPSATLSQPGGHLAVPKEVLGRTDDGIALRVPCLDWYASSDRFSCPKGLSLLGPRGTMTLDELEGDLSTRRLVGTRPRVRWRVASALSRQEKAQLR